jgi:hypothetical protein
LESNIAWNSASITLRHQKEEEKVIKMKGKLALILMKIEEIQARYPHWHMRSNAFIDDTHIKSLPKSDPPNSVNHFRKHRQEG